MKKIIFGLIVTLGISIATFGQATLEHSYLSNWTFREQPNAFKTSNGLNYISVEGTNVMKIYNSSHNLTNTLIVPLDNNFIIDSVIGASDKLFNNDSLIEFLIISYNTIDYSRKIVLIDENGTILQNFGERSYAYFIKGVSGEYKLVTAKFGQPNGGNNSTFDIYSLPGTTLGSVSLNEISNSFFGFPNPTENKITITNNLENGQKGTLEIFDVNGIKVIQKNVVGEENGQINLDTTELSAGIYIYKLNGQTNRFIKK